MTHIVICDSVASARWSDEEKKAVDRHLGHLIQLRRAPRKHECLTVLQKEPVLASRDWRSLKNHIASKVRYSRLKDRKTAY